MLKWSTKNNEIVSNFIIERSLDGIRYAPVGSCYPNNSGFNQYFDNFSLKHDHIEQSAVIYYRIVILEKSNNKSISVVKSVAIYNSELLEISPNPAKNYLEIKCNNLYSLSLFDQKGKLLIDQKVDTQPTKIDISTLSNGMYILKMTQQNKNSIYRKIIKN